MISSVITHFALRPLDFFEVPHICSSLSFSPTGEFLATCHAGCLGVYLWVNRTLYQPMSGARALPEGYRPKLMPLPGASSDGLGRVINLDPDARGEDEDERMAVDHEEFVSPEQIANDLVTLALLPESKWANLLNLDVVKV
jgi:U3 small nucleolar RNA-associated protein 21